MKKLYSIELQNAKHINKQRNIFLTALVLTCLTVVPLCLEHSCLNPTFSFPKVKQVEKQCSIFIGKWIPYPKGPYYTNSTCRLISDQQNCVKYGRNDTDFTKWRWKPDECELPLFDAVRFLEVVRNKAMAFVGDSVGRNQMQSLLCLLSNASHPEDISRNYTSDVINFKRWYYADYNFTLATLWAPYLVKSRDTDSGGHSSDSLMSLYLDEADDSWATQIENFDYLIISAGQWFFRPLIHVENGQAGKCHRCNINNITSVPVYYGYRMAFRTTFQKILRTENFKGVTFLRTFSPAHFENGDWNNGGSCGRTRPYTSEEMKLDGYLMQMYNTQMEEFRAAEKEGRRRGLKFNLLNTTEIMLMRPDGHPNTHVWWLRHQNVSVADCVHWCLPGPVDTWNEFLFYMLEETRE